MDIANRTSVDLVLTNFPVLITSQTRIYFKHNNYIYFYFDFYYYFYLLMLKIFNNFKNKINHLRNVSAPDEARRLGFVFEAEMLRCTPRCVGLWADAFVVAPASLPPILRKDSDEPEREPSLSGYKYRK